jgi:hypothetical protein
MYDEHEKPEPSLPRELAELERRLASLTPAAPSIERDRLMFTAGAASVEPPRRSNVAEPPWLGVRFWQAATAVATAASLLLAITLAWDRTGQAPSSRSQHVVVDRVEVPPPFAPQRELDRLPAGYLGLRQVALAQGVGALETASSSSREGKSFNGSPPATSRQLRQELLHLQEKSNS